MLFVAEFVNDYNQTKLADDEVSIPGFSSLIRDGTQYLNSISRVNRRAATKKFGDCAHSGSGGNALLSFLLTYEETFWIEGDAAGSPDANLICLLGMLNQTLIFDSDDPTHKLGWGGYLQSITFDMNSNSFTRPRGWAHLCYHLDLDTTPPNISIRNKFVLTMNNGDCTTLICGVATRDGPRSFIWDIAPGLPQVHERGPSNFDWLAFTPTAASVTFNCSMGSRSWSRITTLYYSLMRNFVFVTDTYGVQTIGLQKEYLEQIAREEIAHELRS